MNQSRETFWDSAYLAVFLPITGLPRKNGARPPDAGFSTIAVRKRCRFDDMLLCFGLIWSIPLFASF